MTTAWGRLLLKLGCLLWWLCVQGHAVRQLEVGVHELDRPALRLQGKALPSCACHELRDEIQGVKMHRRCQVPCVLVLAAVDVSKDRVVLVSPNSLF